VEVEVLAVPIRSRDDVKVALRDVPATGFRNKEMSAIVPWLGVCQPHVDTGHGETLAYGVKGRMGSLMPPVLLENFYPRLKDFVRRFIAKRGIRPLPPDTDFSVETWLDTTHYPRYRKVELQEKYDSTLNLLEKVGGSYKNFFVKLFAKDETYLDWKQARGIYARSDEAKVYFGPIFKQIEKVVFDPNVNPEFVKKIPVRDRGRYVMERLGNGEGNVFLATDYSSFECHFNAQLMEACELVLYEHMLSEVPGGGEMFEVISSVLTGRNCIYNKRLVATVQACRMSGEMNTSLGNGFSNLMLMHFVCEMKGIEATCVIEGDDGLLAINPAIAPTTEDFTQLGCKIKLETYGSMCEASFCGLVFDEEDQHVLTDPLDVLATTGWAPARYANAKHSKRNALLRAKALSLLYQYPAAPIISAFARALLRRTSGINIDNVLESKGISMWEREQMMGAKREGKFWEVELFIGSGSRHLVERVYGISVADQLRTEVFLDCMGEDSDLKLDWLLASVPPSWTEYWDKYVFTDTSTDQQIEIQPPVWKSALLEEKELYAKLGQLL
jgi:hypothetical protein